MADRFDLFNTFKLLRGSGTVDKVKKYSQDPSVTMYSPWPSIVTHPLGSVTIDGRGE